MSFGFGEDTDESSFQGCFGSIPNPDGASFTHPDFEAASFTFPNLNCLSNGLSIHPKLIASNYFTREPTHIAATKDTATSATSQVGEQANNDLRLSLQCTKTTEPTTATATAGTDRSSSSTGFSVFLAGVTGPDWPGQPGISMECDVEPTLNKGGGGDDNNNNNLPVTSTVPVASAITDKPEIRKRGRPTGVGSTISLEQLQQQFGKTLQEAADSFNVSLSTLKRVTRGYEISPWPGPKKNNRVVKKARNCITSSEPDPKKLEATEATNSIQTTPPTAAESAMLTFKAYFGGDSILRFELPSKLKMVDVKQQVAKRLKLKIGSFNISYRDEDEGEWVLITCDVDLLRAALRWTKIQIRVEPITNLTTLTSKYYK
ncbi:hypothetical protein LguiA_021926 [Lonicera macranthoides]